MKVAYGTCLLPDPIILSLGSNVFQKSIHPVGRTHETLHRRTLFLEKYESTLARPIHTHNKDNHFGRVSSVSVLSSFGTLETKMKERHFEKENERTSFRDQLGDLVTPDRDMGLVFVTPDRNLS